MGDADKTALEVFAVCDDCREHGDGNVYPPNMTAILPNGRRLCEDCFENGDYMTYDEDEERWVPDWNDLPAPSVNDAVFTINGKRYRLAPA